MTVPTTEAQAPHPVPGVDAGRASWRALALVIKAKLEAVEVGIVVFEDEFLANTVPPGASVTFGEAVRDQMRLAHEGKSLTPLLPFIRGDDTP